MDENPQPEENLNKTHDVPKDLLDNTTDKGDSVPEAIEPELEKTEPAVLNVASAHSSVDDVAELNSAQEVKPAASTPGQVVLQWVTYAFWGFAFMALSSVAVATLLYYMDDAESGMFATYALAAVFVLFPIAAICDLFYIKQEPAKKTGASSVVMIIHTVLFALLAIGSLITAVFSLVSMLITASDITSAQASALSAVVVALLYAGLVLRTLAPSFMYPLRKNYVIIMTFIGIAICVAAAVGPIGGQVQVRDDKLIEDSLSSVAYAVRSYANKNDKLPDSLNDVTVTGNARQLVDRNLVKYSKVGTDTDEYYSTALTYKLCVEYKKAKNEGSIDTYYRQGDYDTTPSTYSHPKGEVCYELATEYVENNSIPMLYPDNSLDQYSQDE